MREIVPKIMVIKRMANPTTRISVLTIKSLKKVGWLVPSSLESRFHGAIIVSSKISIENKLKTNQRKLAKTRLKSWRATV